MKVAVLVAGGVPNPTAGGAAVTMWTILTELVRQGHEARVIVLTDPEVWDPTGVATTERIAAVEALGVEVVTLTSASAPFFRTRPRGIGSRLRRAWRPSDEELYPNLVDADAVKGAVAATEAEVAFVYHFEMLAASRDLAIPRFAAVGDPPHLSSLHRFRELLPRPSAFRRIVRLQAQLRHQPPLLVRFLRECEASGAFAAHHAESLRRQGVAGCRYLRTPVPDPGPPFAEGGGAERPTILLVGHLRGVVTLEGLRLFAQHVLPALERELGSDGFEVRIAGGYDLPPDLAQPLSRPSIRLLGHVERADEEFRRAHVLLVPNSIPLGIRVRVITGFSFGSCIVTHRANSLGIPELVHEQNALVGDSPQELAAHVIRAVRDVELRRRLGGAARATYESRFAPELVVGELAGTLDEIAGGVPAPDLMRVLVTGGAGFIGSHLCDALVARGDDVTAFDDLSTGFRDHLPPGARLVVGSVADAESVRRCVAEGFDAVLHVAGQASIATSFAHPERDLTANVVGTVNVLGACTEATVPRLVYASSMTVYGEPAVVPTPEDEPCRPVSYYGITKYAAERYALVTGERADTALAVTALRMFNVYGERQSLTNPYQGVLAIFLGNVLRGEPITIHSDGRQTRDFVHVDDALDAWLRVLEEPATNGAALNVGSGRETTIGDLAEAVVAACGENPGSWEIRRGPAQKGDQRRAAADVSRIEAVTGWSPSTPLDEGLRRTVEWARAATAVA